MPCYSQKATKLKYVEAGDALYSADAKQTAVAFAKYGKGWVGYVGDVNGEEGSDKVILAMCGLCVDEDD